VKFLENQTREQRIDAARSVLILESAVALVQVIIAMVTGNAANWFAAMFVIVLGTIAWVVLTPDE
jgi:membrane protein YdbS with pleckstrin-like domain